MQILANFAKLSTYKTFHFQQFAKINTSTNFCRKARTFKEKTKFQFFSLSFNADTLQATIQSIKIISECLFFLSTTTSTILSLSVVFFASPTLWNNCLIPSSLHFWQSVSSVLVVSVQAFVLQLLVKLKRNIEFLLFLTQNISFIQGFLVLAI